MKPHGRVPRARKLLFALLAVALVTAGPRATVLTTTQFSEGFDVPGDTLDISRWTTEFGAPAFLGRTWLRNWVTNSATNRFVVADGAAQLALDTFGAGGSLLSGTHAKTVVSFQPDATTDYILSARVRLTSLQPGLVFGIYFYGCYPGCDTRHDELDIEILTNYLQPGSSPLRVQLNRYAAEPLGAGHGPIVNLPAGFDPMEYHEWAIRWAIDRVTYFVDGQELFSASSFVPQGPMSANMIVWAPAPEWADAYHASLQPAASSDQNRRFVALVDSVSVSTTSHIPAPSSRTLFVTNTFDSGPGSLRQTIAEAVAGDTIAFSRSVTGVITLTSGEIAISKDLHISGPGFNLLTISGNKANRIFTTAATISISGLTFSSGVAPDFGGAISNAGALTLNDCVFAGNFAGALGNGRGQGGAVWSTGSLSVLKSLFSGNRSTGNGGAIRSSGALVVERSTFNGNIADFFGGGIYNFRTGTVSASILSANQANVGGGIWNENEPLRIANTTISGNAAGFGGGLATKWGSVTTLNTTFSGNTAGSGGGIYFAFGPGPGKVLLINSTITGNRATGSNGGGGVSVSGALNLLNSLVALNSVASVSAPGPDIAGTVISLGHNLVGDSSGSVGLVHGVQGDQVGSSNSPLDPNLGPLDDNGGLTKTHALQPGSPGVDAGDRSVLGLPYALASDQRGGSRSTGVAPDIGSFELGSTPLPVSTITKQPSSQSIASGETATLCVTTGGVSPHSFQWFSAGGPAAQLIEGATSACFTTPPLTVSSDFFVRVTSLSEETDSEIARVTVKPPPPTATLIVSPGTIVAGHSAVLNWTTTNATTVTINQGIGSVAASGTLTVSPANLTTYTITATNFTDTVTATATLTVTPGLRKLSPSNAALAQAPVVTLSWQADPTATNYEYCVDETDNEACDTGWVSAGLATVVDSNALSSETQHYWQVRAQTPTGLVTADGGSWWRFTTGAFRLAQLVHPIVGRPLAGATATFAWDTGVNITEFSLSIGLTPGGGEIYQRNESGLLRVVATLPIDGRTIYVRLWSRSAGRWAYRDYEFQAAMSNQPETQVVPVLGDYDGDGKSDFALWLGDAGLWFFAKSTTGHRDWVAVSWGSTLHDDRPVPGDYDGDGKFDPAVWRPSDGTWYVLLSSTNYSSSSAWPLGTAAHQLVPGDYDGDQKTDPAVWSPLTGFWLILRSSSSYLQTQSVQWGRGHLGDRPVPADYDGDGKTDPAIWRGPSGEWYWLRSATQYADYGRVSWGRESLGDRPVPFDFDGDRKSDPAIWRGPSGDWYWLRSATGYAQYGRTAWGREALGDRPVTADYDGDGRGDLAVWRPTEGRRYVTTSSTTYVGWFLLPLPQ